MTAKIIRFNQHKSVEFIDLFRQGNSMKFDVLLHINGLPFILKNVSIREINKNKIRFYYDSLHHYIDEKNDIEICPFCEKAFEDSICEPLTKEKNEIFSHHISQQLFFPIMSYFYNDHNNKFFDDLAATEIDSSFKPLFFGVSEGTYIQCIFEFKGETLLFQDVINDKKGEVLPLIFYFDSKYQQLHLYIEYILPENLVPLTSAINKQLHKPGVELFDTTGIALVDLYSDFIQKDRTT